MNKVIPQNIKEIMQKLIANKYEIYIIGGAVRDYLLGKTPHDWDLFTNATGEQILELYPKGIVLGNEERQEKILTVLVSGVEVSQYRKSGDRKETGMTLREHCATCDLTINSMAMDIHGQIIDYFDGEKDLKAGIIRAVGNPDDRVDEDLLRVLRALRFKSKYNFFIENNLAGTIVANKLKLKKLPIERVRDEIIKMIAYPSAIDVLHQYGIDKMFIKPLYDCWNIEGGNNHNEPVHEHNILTWKESLILTDDWRIHLACLLHDTGKPNVLENIKGKITFYQHELEGYHLVKKWMKEMKFGKKDTDFICTLIRTHMQGYNKEMTKKAYLRFFQKLAENGITIRQWHIIRFCDGQGNKANPRYKYCDSSQHIVEKYFQYKYSEEPFKVTDLKIDGSDAIKLGYEGKQIGEVLKEALELVEDAKLKNTRISLMEWLNDRTKKI